MIKIIALFKKGKDMGLFSDKKKYFYGIDVVDAKMEFDDFKNALGEYFNSDACKSLLNGNNTSLELASEMEDVLMTGCEQSYKWPAKMDPYGDFNIAFFEKGTMQGASATTFSIRMSAEMKKNDKDWASRFYSSILDHYETTFNAGGNKKMFDSNTRG